MTTHYYPFPHPVENGEGATTSRKSVTCETCLSLIGPDPEKLNGYHFPATKFVGENSSDTQVLHVNEEFNEWMDEDTISRSDLIEAWDVLHSMETYLRIRAKEGADVEAAKRAVYEKNRGRGYYAK